MHSLNKLMGFNVVTLLMRFNVSKIHYTFVTQVDEIQCSQILDTLVTQLLMKSNFVKILDSFVTQIDKFQCNQHV